MKFQTISQRYGIFAVILSIAFFANSCKEQSPAQAPPPGVKVVEVTKADVPLKVDLIGQTYGFVDIPIRARVEGFLTGIHFEEGSNVKKGQLLYTIDPEPYEAIVAESMSRLAEANTMLAKAESDLNRIRPLAEMNAVSKSDLDAAEAQFGAAKASVEAAEASLRYAKINLGYSKIYSPISGLIGKTEAKTGEFVGAPPNPVVLNAVSRIDTILVQFSIAESDFLNLARYILERSKQDSLAEDVVNEGSSLTLILSDGSEFSEQGIFNFANRQVNPTTGSILMQASFSNPDRLLRPGQFARVRAQIDKINGALIIPQRSVREFQGVYQVYVVTEEGVVEPRNVKLGPSAGSMYIVTEGVGEGEKIIFEGHQFARPGATVAAQVVDVPSELMKF